MTPYRPIWLTFAATAALAAAGCQHLNLFQRYSLNKLPRDSREHPIREVIALWEPAEGTDMDGAPCRGFAGQVLFFAHGIDEPVRVDGDVIIYVFDDQGDEEEQSHPLHTFKFEGGAWEAYLRGTKTLGATYQIFIPYTRKGAHQATCSLRVKYEPRGGIPIYSKMASIILAGTKQKDGERRPADPDRQPAQSSSPTSAPVQRASFEELKQFAQQQMQQVSASSSSSSGSSVLTVQHPQTPDLEAERQRLNDRVQGLLYGTEPRDEGPALQPWEPVSQTIVPKPITPEPSHHPLE